MEIYETDFGRLLFAIDAIEYYRMDNGKILQRNNVTGDILSTSY